MLSSVVAQHNYSFVNRTVACAVPWLKRLVAPSQASPCGIYGTGTGFPPSISFNDCSILIHLSFTVCNLGSWQRHWI